MAKSKKEQQQLIVAIVLMVVGGLYVYWNYLMAPTLAKIKKNETKYTDLVNQIEKAQARARNLPRLQAELENLKVDLANVEKQLPKETDIPNVIRILTREALREEIEFKRVAPANPVAQTYFEVIPFSITLEGTLHSLVRFLSNLGQQERIFKAENIRLTPTGAGGTGLQKLTINLTIQTYAYRG